MTNPVILDSSGQQWQLSCNDDGTGPVETPVSGQTAVPFINVNSATDNASWQITVVPNPPPAGSNWGDLVSTSIAQGNYPVQIVVASPNGTFYGIQVETIGPDKGIIDIVGPVAAPIEPITQPPSIFGTQPFAPFIEPMDVWYADTGELNSEGGAGGSVNIPWLLALSLSIGNATTAAISRNCVVFCEVEWGEGTGSGKGSMYGNGGTGSGEGGLYVSW